MTIDLALLAALGIIIGTSLGLYSIRLGDYLRYRIREWLKPGDSNDTGKRA